MAASATLLELLEPTRADRIGVRKVITDLRLELDNSLQLMTGHLSGA